MAVKRLRKRKESNNKKLSNASLFTKCVTYRPKEHKGFRSKFEWQLAQKLDMAGIDYEYEQDVIRYIVPARTHKYTPDFKIKGKNFYIEVKGLFDKEDRQKHKLLKEQGAPEVRFVFYDANRVIYKGSKTTYATWCEKNGFKYSNRIIPDEWLDEE